jgi:hypothetical protein
MKIARFALGLVCLSLLVTVAAHAADEAKGPHPFSVADGQLKFTAVEGWNPTKPGSNIIEHEFTVPASEGDANAGRVTVMGAGGSVEQNIDRWFTQFSQPDGGSTRDKAKVKKITVDGEDIHMVDISGTFKDQKGPFAPAVEREKYRMLAAIVVTKKLGNYFIKFYGPERTVTDNEGNFTKLIESLEHK